MASAKEQAQFNILNLFPEEYYFHAHSMNFWNRLLNEYFAKLMGYVKI